MANAQSRTITGTVTAGDTNEPLPGINIVVKGTSRGIITDMNGDFQIALDPSDEILVFSYIGYDQQKIEIDNQSTIDVTLQVDTKALKEVVVIG